MLVQWALAASNIHGMDLNRNWDKPADPELSPENAALERWLEREIAAGRKPHLALELHNDGNGLLHISRPPVPQLDRHLARMTIFEQLLRQHTWFTATASTPPSTSSTATGLRGYSSRHRAGIGWTTAPAWRGCSTTTSCV